MGDLILLAKAVSPGRTVANRSVSPHGHAGWETARSGVSRTAPEEGSRAGDGDSVRESRPPTRVREGGRRTSARSGRRAAAPSAPGRPAQGVRLLAHADNGASPGLVVATALVDEQRPQARPAFFLDLACPFSYIAAERVERMLGDIEWVPTPSEPIMGGEGDRNQDTVLARATALARAARLPLVWPERFPAPVPRALRAAAYAAEVGAAARFALAASRLAFCGGFDLEKPAVLADVAAAAGVS